MRRRRNFTLVELIVVIAIIAVLSSIIAPNAYRAIEKAKVSSFAQDVKGVRGAVYSLYSDTGQFPGHYEDIRCPLITGANCGGGYQTWRNVAGWDGPYLEKSIQYYWQGRGAMSFQNSCVDTGKDWDGDSGCELFFCYQPAPPISAQVAIDRALDGGDGAFAGMIRGRINENWAANCFWPGFLDQ